MGGLGGVMATLLLRIREVLLFCDQAHSFEIRKEKVTCLTS